MASQLIFLLVRGTLFLCAAKVEEVRGRTHVQLDVIASSIAYISISILYIYIQVHLKKWYMVKKFFLVTYFRK